MAFGDARKNFAWSTVATAPSPATSGTSLVVASGEGARFPAVSFNAVIAPAGATPSSANSEIVRVTGVSTDTLTITRAQESTSARTVVVGDRIYTGTTAADFHAPATSGITTIQPDDAAAVGTAETYARGDHKHAIVADTAATLTGTNAEGSSTSFARADHNHTFPTWGVASGGIYGLLASTATGATNTWYAVRVMVLSATTLTGIRYAVGGTSNGNCRSALFDSGLTKVADLTSNVAQATANTMQALAFDSTYSAAPGTYYGLIWFSSATATTMAAVFSSAASTGTNATTTPSSIGVPAFGTTALRPVLIAY